MANAVANALASFGATPNQLPLSPAAVWCMGSAKQATSSLATGTRRSCPTTRQDSIGIEYERANRRRPRCATAARRWSLHIGGAAIGSGTLILPFRVEEIGRSAETLT
jgi:hypothetical protein